MKLKTHQELKEEQNRVIEWLPLGDITLYGMDKNVYDKIRKGVNTVEQLYNELDEEPQIIDETLENLNRMGLVELTETQRLPIE